MLAIPPIILLLMCDCWVNAGIFYSKEKVEISQNNIVKEFTTESEIPCILSCNKSTSCIASAEKTKNGKKICLHLNGSGISDQQSALAVTLHKRSEKISQAKGEYICFELCTVILLSIFVT